MKNLAYMVFVLLLGACQYPPQEDGKADFDANVGLVITEKQARELSELPLACLNREFPNKLGQVLGDSEALQTPKQLHPAFFGCFDWHSAVHGTWMMVRLAKEFPRMKQDTIRTVLAKQITTENIMGEIAFFESEYNENFERTYGWAWLLKLHGELLTWNDSLGQALAANLEPLADFIVGKYEEFLPKLSLPLRSGEHINTAFGMSFAYDYAKKVDNQKIKVLIEEKAKLLYLNDKNANLSFEPSAYDFLSPSLEEVNLMRRVLTKDQFMQWLAKFLPEMFKPDFDIEPQKVIDREDGKLVHMDGLNLSRAWCLYAISRVDPKLGHLKILADKHLEASLDKIIDGSYAGEHWLASFALHALLERERVREI